MTNEFKELSKKINILKEKKKIKIENNKFVNVGLLLEKELGIIQNAFAVADFDGIELKVSRYSSDLPIILFCCTCDGPNVFELNEFVNRYGYFDKVYKNTKVLYIKLSNNSYTFCGNSIKMRLYVDRVSKKIFIVVVDKNENLVEQRVFWEFSTLENIIERKIKLLCLVLYKINYFSGQKYCFFENFIYLKCLGLQRFLNLIEDGTIKINIKYGVYRNGDKKGKSYNHGTSFEIKKDSLYKLFSKIQ